MARRLQASLHSPAPPRPLVRAGTRENARCARASSPSGRASRVRRGRRRALRPTADAAPPSPPPQPAPPTAMAPKLKLYTYPGNKVCDEGRDGGGAARIAARRAAAAAAAGGRALQRAGGACGANAQRPRAPEARRGSLRRHRRRRRAPPPFPPLFQNANKALIAAKYAGVAVDTPRFTLGTDNKTPAFLKLSPSGKVPALEVAPGVGVFESNAIARYIAKLAPDAGLLGGGDPLAQAQVRVGEGGVDGARKTPRQAPPDPSPLLSPTLAGRCLDRLHDGRSGRPAPLLVPTARGHLAALGRERGGRQRGPQEGAGRARRAPGDAHVPRGGRGDARRHRRRVQRVFGVHQIVRRDLPQVRPARHPLVRDRRQPAARQGGARGRPSLRQDHDVRPDDRGRGQGGPARQGRAGGGRARGARGGRRRGRRAQAEEPARPPPAVPDGARLLEAALLQHARRQVPGGVHRGALEGRRRPQLADERGVPRLRPRRLLALVLRLQVPRGEHGQLRRHEQGVGGEGQRESVGVLAG
jgi:hypothetical protein